MKVSKVAFRMLRVHAQYENNVAEVEVVLGPKDRIEDAFVVAKNGCATALGLPTSKLPATSTCSACGLQLNSYVIRDVRCKGTGGAHVVSLKESK